MFSKGLKRRMFSGAQEGLLTTSRYGVSQVTSTRALVSRITGNSLYVGEGVLFTPTWTYVTAPEEVSAGRRITTAWNPLRPPAPHSPSSVSVFRESVASCVEYGFGVEFG